MIRFFQKEDAVDTRYALIKNDLHQTAKDLQELNVIDKIIKEPSSDNKEKDFEKICNDIKKEIAIEIARMKNMTPNEIVEERYNKFRNMGEFVNLV